MSKRGKVYEEAENNSNNRFINACAFVGLPIERGKEGKGPFLYYVNMEGTALEKESYEIKEKTPKKAVDKMLEKLAETPEDIEVKASIPSKVKIKKQK